MNFVKDFSWEKGISVEDFVARLGNVGFQSVELKNASDIFTKMKLNGSKIFLTFTSNMVTSGLRGFFAQLVKLGMADVIVTTIGGLEEDIMKSLGEKFSITSFNSDDLALHEKGMNRIGNLMIDTQAYLKFENKTQEILKKLYDKKKRWTPSEMFKEIGLMLDDENSLLYQAARKDVPIYCPAITDGAFGFHLYLFQQKHKDFIVDVVGDFGNIVARYGHDDKKGLITLGGSISKHHAILAGLLNGGFDYAVYMTTARATSGSMSGATTQEAKSWGKIKDDSDAVTVIGDVSINFPLAMIKSLETLSKEGALNE